MNLTVTQLTIKPVPRVYTAQGFPAKRVINHYQFFTVAGTALVGVAEKLQLDHWYQWQAADFLAVLGLGDYVLRNKTPPRHTSIDCTLYESTFEFEAKRVSQGQLGKPVGDYAGLPQPIRQSFSEGRLEHRTVQKFSSGRTRQLQKRRGVLRDVRFGQELSFDEMRRFLSFWLEYDHQPLVVQWLTDYFGVGRKLVFAQDPWQLKIEGKRAELSVQGFVV